MIENKIQKNGSDTDSEKGSGRNQKAGLLILIQCGIFTALTAVGAFLTIPLPMIPITLQIFFTALAGLLLGARTAALSQLLYVLIGLCGLPVFAGGSAGISYVLHPTFGYLIGFILGAWVIGSMTVRMKKPDGIRLFAACFCGLAVIYAVGVPYLYGISTIYLKSGLTFSQAVMTGAILCLPGDLLKILLAALTGARLLPVLRKNGFI